MSFSGTSGADSWTGATTDDLIFGLAANDTLRGGGGNDSIDGGADNDSLFGDAGNDTLLGDAGADTIDGGSGNDRLEGGDDGDRLNGRGNNDTVLGGGGDDTLIGEGSNDCLEGGAGNDQLFGGFGRDTLVGLGGDTLNGEGDNNIYVVSGSGNVINGGNADDRITFAVQGTYSFSASGGGFVATGPGGTTNTVSGVESVIDRTGTVVPIVDGLSVVVCFAAGTRILTAQGEKPVEALRPGELVATLSGQGSPLKPVVFLGRRRIVLAGHPNAAELSPVRIRAGALGDSTPHRDLLVSPDHCLFLDGALVPARLLVNGTSVTVERGLAEVTYYHVELPGHDVVLAEGAAAESWLDAGNRAWFENAPTALLRVDAALDAYASEEPEPCAPVIQAGPRLAAIRDRIALRGHAPASVPARLAMTA